MSKTLIILFLSLLLFIVIPFTILTFSNNHIQGIIINKKFTPEHIKVIDVATPHFTNLPDGNSFLYFTHSDEKINVPDTYLLIVSGSCNTFLLTVDKAEYQRYNIGDNYPHLEKQE
jgi:hypothetical protein